MENPNLEIWQNFIIQVPSDSAAVTFFIPDRKITINQSTGYDPPKNEQLAPEKGMGKMTFLFVCVTNVPYKKGPC